MFFIANGSVIDRCASEIKISLRSRWALKTTFNKLLAFFGECEAVRSDNLHRLIDVPMGFQIRNIVP